MAVGEVGGHCKSYYVVVTLVRENSGNFKVDLLFLCEPCTGASNYFVHQCFLFCVRTNHI